MKPLKKEDQSVLQKLSESTRNVLENFLTSPSFEKELQALDLRRVSKQKELVAELGRTSALRESAVAEEARKCDKAAQLYRTAEQALADHKTKFLAAQRAVDTVEFRHRDIEFSLRKELVALSDSRLEAFKAQLEQIKSNPLRAAIQYFQATENTEWGYRHFLTSNTQDVIAASDALSAAIHEVEGLKFTPLTHAEVSEHLSRMCLELAPVLAKVEINPPSLSAAMEVGPAHRWSGQSVWVFDSLPNEPTAEERRELSELDGKVQRQRERQVAGLYRKA